MKIVDAVPNEEPDAPSALARARKLAEEGQDAEALAAFDEFLHRSGQQAADRYTAYVGAARCCDALDLGDRLLDYAFGALRTDSCPAEAFVVIGRHFFRLEEWSHAVPYLVAATTRQSGGGVGPEYSWLPWDLLTVCYYQLGELEKSLEAAMRALDGNPERPRVIENMHWAIKGIASAGPPAPPKIVRVSVPKNKKRA